MKVLISTCVFVTNWLVYTVAHGGVLFSVDVGTDELVRIDTSSGIVTVIGSIGFDLSSTDLTSMNGRLYALDAQVNIRADIYELDPLNGSILSSAQVHTSAVNVGLAEGLTHVGGQLKIGFRDDASAPFPSFSNRLGDLSAVTGLITNTQTSPQTGYLSPDLDSLAVDLTNGQIYSVDVNPPSGSNDTIFQTVSQFPFTTSTFLTDSNDLSGVGIAVLGNTLFGVGADSRLYSIDLNTNSLSSIALDRVGNYGGLAIAAAVPEPSSAVAFCFVLFVAAGSRIRKQ